MIVLFRIPNLRCRKEKNFKISNWKKQNAANDRESSHKYFPYLYALMQKKEHLPQVWHVKIINNTDKEVSCKFLLRTVAVLIFYCL